jgi:hypothetical protein
MACHRGLDRLQHLVSMVTLPDTVWKSLIAAALTEAGLPPAARIVGKAIVALLKALAPLIAPR